MIVFLNSNDQSLATPHGELNEEESEEKFIEDLFAALLMPLPDDEEVTS